MTRFEKNTALLRHHNLEFWRNNILDKMIGASATFGSLLERVMAWMGSPDKRRAKVGRQVDFGDCILEDYNEGNSGAYTRGQKVVQGSFHLPLKNVTTWRSIRERVRKIWKRGKCAKLRRRFCLRFYASRNEQYHYCCVVYWEDQLYPQLFRTARTWWHWELKGQERRAQRNAGGFLVEWMKWRKFQYMHNQLPDSPPITSGQNRSTFTPPPVAVSFRQSF